jgi:alanyl-tRNA synthetase
VKDLYIILDHCRTVFLTIYDGSLPSNVGGGSNVRNILRRIFALLKKHQWWNKIQMEGLMHLFKLTKIDLESLYGPFAEYKSFDDIIKLEYEKYLNTDGVQK